jgi:MFS family permease
MSHAALESRVSEGQLAATVALAFGLTLLTSTLEPALIGNRIIVLAGAEQGRAALFGAVTFGGLLVATITQPIVGMLSDYAVRRLPFMWVGVCTAISGIGIIALAQSLPVLMGGLVLLQFGNNTALAAWQPLIAETIPQAQRGTASGFKALFDLLAAMVGRLAAGELVAYYDVWGSTALLAAAAVPAFGLIFTLLIVSTVIREGTPSTQRGMPAHPHWWILLRESFTVNWRAHPQFAWWCLNRVLFWCAFIAASAFLLFVAVSGFGMTESDAQRYIGRLVVLLGGALAIVILPAGMLADRVGRKPPMILGGVLAGIGAALIVLARDQIILAAICVGAGVGMYLSSSLALINDIVPRQHTARYLGIANIATALGSAIARLGGGATIDIVNAATATRDGGFVALYIGASVLFFLSAIVAAVQPNAPRTPHLPQEMHEASIANNPNRESASATA